MVLFNYSTKELTAKIVYYGPGLCGKTTNLQFIHGNLPTNVKGKMLSLATKTDRTLFFDFLPLDLGTIRGMKTRIQLYTVPGQVFYNETRKLVLKGADGIVFVADSQEQMLSANVESFRNLEDNLRGHGMRLADIPHVIQFNKRDLPRASSIEDMNAAVNKYNAPFYESVATTGIGVQDTLKAITKLVLLHLTSKYDPKRGVSRPGIASEAVRPPSVPGVAVPVSRPAVSPVRGIPLSDAGEGSLRRAEAAGFPVAASSGPPPPPDFRAAAPSQGVGEPDVDDLLDEVDDLRAVGAELDRDEFPRAEEPVLRPFPEPGEPMASDHPPLSEWMPLDDQPAGPVPVAAAPHDDAPDRFEIDTSFDPEWSPGVGSATGQAPGAADLRVSESMPPDVLAPFPPPADQDSDDVAFGPEDGSVRCAPDDAVIELTEVADDRSLFEDPLLDVARLAAGEAKEIVVPVEIGEGASVRRFKLSLTLRLDPVE